MNATRRPQRPPRTRRRPRLNGYPVAQLASVFWLSAGCQLFGGLDVRSVADSANPPGQVAIYASVVDGEQPVPQLQAENFAVYEDGKQLNRATVGLQLLDRDAVSLHHTLILVDLSGSIEEPGRLNVLTEQLATFVERIRAVEDVSVYGFDGGAALYPFGKFSKNKGADTLAQVKASLSALSQHRQRDPSSNLNGAVLAGVAQLDYHLRQTPKRIRLGTLVVVAQGDDLAGRTTEERLREVLKQTPHHRFALVVAPDGDDALAEKLGENGHVLATSIDNLDAALGQLATLVEQDYGQYYLVSYCSPARAGKRTLLLEVSRPDSGGSADTASMELPFDATGFSSQCDSSRVPRFPVSSNKSQQQTSSAGAPGSSNASGDGAQAAPAAPAEDSPAVAPPPPGAGYAE